MSAGLNVGTLAGFLELDANPFEKSLDRALARAETKTGKRMEQIGGDMTRKLTLPLVAVGVASVKMASDYDTAFARMVGLAGVPKGEIDGLKQSVLDLAGETAVAPAELADALYFAASAGLDAAGAMKAVDVAARASAAGMGRTADIVGLVASAVESYGKENIDAARATDILTAAVRAGRADPEELAGSLGRVLPVAAQLGVEFDEVGGAVAYLSNVFGDTNRTVTALSGLLVKLVSPTAQGREALTEMGTSIEELQAAIDRDGLMGALELLREKGFAGNQRALRALFDDIEGYQAALALLNDRSGSLAETMDEVSNSAGALDDAFSEVEGTSGHKFKQAITDAQVALIEMGGILVPLAADVAGFASTLLRLFSDLPGPVQGTVIAFSALLAAVGPITSIAGKLHSNWSKLSDLFSKVRTEASWLKDDIASAGLGKIGMVAGGAAAGVGIFALAMFKASERAAELRAAARELADEAERTGESLEEVAVRKMARTFAESDRVADAMDRLGVSFDELRGPLQGSDADFDAWRESLMAAAGESSVAKESANLLAGRVARLREELGAAETVTTRTAEAERSLGIESEEAAPKVDQVTEAQQEQQAATEELTEAIDKLIEATLAQFDSNLGYRRSIDGVEESMHKLNALTIAGYTETEEYRDALLDAEGAMLGQAAAAVRLAEDQAAANGETLSAEEKARLYKEELIKLAGTLEPGSPLRKQLEGYIGDLNTVPGKVETLVATPGLHEAVARFMAWKAMIDSIPRTVTVTVNGVTQTRPNVDYRTGGRQSGGLVGPNMPPPGPTDTLHAMLTPGEYVVPAAVVDRIGVGKLEAMLAGDTRSLVSAQAAAGGGGGGALVVEVPIMLDGRKIGEARTVVDGIDRRRASRARDTGEV